MKFRVKDLEKYFYRKLNWKEVTKVLTDKAFESYLDEEFLEVDILTNRYADASSFIGLAQEISALLEIKIKYPAIRIKEVDEPISKFIKIKKLTPKVTFYSGRVILSIKNRPSPQWLKELVESYGFNSINFLVDLSNFIMLEYGAPLHVFDLDKLTNKRIEIREAKRGEKFRALNNEVYELNGGEIVIAGEEKILALGGIIGSKEAEVDLNTKNVFIEAAVFSSETIYQTSRNLKIVTEASYRFERKVISRRSLLALDRFSSLVEKNLGGKVVKGKIILGRTERKKIIRVNLERLINFLGFSISSKLIEKYLKLLRFKIVEINKDNLKVIPPDDRIDINIEEDVYEEILRLYGVNRIKKTYETNHHPSSLDENFIFNYKLKDCLKELGFSEVYGYNLFSLKEGEIFREILEKNHKPIIFLNPLSENYYYFEFTLLPNLLKAYSLNKKLEKKLKIFRIEKVAYLEENKIKELYNLGLIISGNDPQEILKELKGILNYIFSKLNISFNITFKNITTNFSSISAQGFINNQRCFWIGLIDKKIVQFYDIDSNVGFLEINLFELRNFSLSYKKFEPWSNYPEIIRDISFYVDKNFEISNLYEFLEKVNTQNLKKKSIIDIYFPQDYINKKSVTLRFIFQSEIKTLTEEEIDAELRQIINLLINKFKIELRD